MKNYTRIVIFLLFGFGITHAKDFVRIEKAKKGAASKTYEEITGQEPAKKVPRFMGSFRDLLTISFGHESTDVDLKVQCWDPIYKRFPGWNSPVIDVYRGKKRLFCGKLKEVGWPTRVWGAYHGRTCYLYVESKHRHRFAKGIYVYSIDPKTGQPKYLSVFFSEAELLRERKEKDAFLNSMRSKKSG
ncbi:MAG: hypothetical protein H7A51_13845 [Akkermansiaceae bacterium]|nr:hypothetical protein [Akkermansiaceae bacterium]